MNQRLKGILAFILVIVFVVGCAMTSKQRVLTTRTAFNSILEQYNGWAADQPEAVKVKLRKDVLPVLEELKDALDLYDRSAYTPGDDPDAKLKLYLDLKTKFVNLVMKYGLKIDEGKVKS